MNLLAATIASVTHTEIMILAAHGIAPALRRPTRMRRIGRRPRLIASDSIVRVVPLVFLLRRLQVVRGAMRRIVMSHRSIESDIVHRASEVIDMMGEARLGLVVRLI
jgi:hypothetical protein